MAALDPKLVEFIKALARANAARDSALARKGKVYDENRHLCEVFERASK